MQYDTKARFYTIKNGEITNFILQQKWAWMCIKSTIQQLNSIKFWIQQKTIW